MKLEGDDALTIFVDTDRDLPVTDPFDRQITIGFGTFLELLVQAAASEGYGCDITLFPEGEDMQTLDARPVAHVRFLAGQGTADPLFAQVLKRRSNKTPYLPQDVEPEKLQALFEVGSDFGMSAKMIGNTDMADSLRQLTWDAHVREATTPDAMQESVDLMRIGKAAVAANPDGIEIEGAMVSVGKMFGLMDPDDMANPESYAFKQGLAMYEELAFSARAFGWLANANTSRNDQINAGRAYVRVNLKATELGLGIHPWSQSLQEYEEMADLYDKVHTLIGDGARIQMLFRIGYANPIAPTPRFGLEEHLV